jgi:predicted AlkP superfamily pyrophosphatase or phosphodiesterase
MQTGSSKIAERVIVFIIDGLHWKAPQQLNMPVLNTLAAAGTYIAQSQMIVPHHPTVGEYGQLHTCSFPNPVLQEGTLFLGQGHKMLQDMFAEQGKTAFVTNTKAYETVSKGFDINIQEPALTDEGVVDESISLLHQQEHEQEIAYMRIHLQTPGNEGRFLTYTSPDLPYYRNIWGAGSPYAAAVEHADSLLGKLVDDLKQTGKWETTLLIVTSDHGQSQQGWHPVIDKDSARTPMLFVGPSIAVNRQLPYFEHTDLSPTIAGLMGVAAPNTDGGAGVFVKAVLAAESADAVEHPRYIETINRQLNEYNALRARLMIAAEKDAYYSSFIGYLENELLTPEPFYHQDRFLEWSRAGNTAHLIEANQLILEQMRNELSKQISNSL